MSDMMGITEGIQVTVGRTIEVVNSNPSLRDHLKEAIIQMEENIQTLFENAFGVPETHEFVLHGYELVLIPIVIGCIIASYFFVFGRGSEIKNWRTNNENKRE